MIFGTLPLAEAEGAILAHSIRMAGQSFEKGRVLSAADIAALKAAEIGAVVAVRLGPGDIPEDEAARRIAERLAGAGLDARAPFTGRVNIHAKAAGLLRLDAVRVNGLNAIHEGITVATLPDYAPLAAGGMAATIKIIPFALPHEIIAEAIDCIGNAPLRLLPFKPKRAALITTLLPSLKASVVAKTRSVTEARLQGLGAALHHVSEVPHENPAIAGALAGALAQGAEIILVAGASATSDREDTVPRAIRDAGGEILHFGMPVDPGNLLLLARIGATPVVGLPGCARSPKLNGVDFVLQRLVADVPVSSSDIKAMGVGGLLLEIPARPQPRASKAAPAAPRIGAVLLAAGLSRRMGRNKLLIPFEGEMLVRRSARLLLEAGLDPILVVTGHEAERIHDALAGLTLRFTHNPDYEEGLASSLVQGLTALDGDAVDAALVALADMPLIRSDQIKRLVAAYNPSEGRLICVPAYGGKQGNPILWDAGFFDEMKQLTGDRGAKPLLAAHAAEIAEIELDDPGILIDVDTPDALARLSAETKP